MIFFNSESAIRYLRCAGTSRKMSRAILTFFVCLLCVGTSLQDPLKVSVYYESLCPDSVRFITQQLAPNYSKLSKLIYVDYVPYGKATHTFVNGKWEFQCQHGANECYGNMMQVCALNQTSDQAIREQFVNCVMSTSYPAADEYMQPCANESGLNWNEMVRCSEDGQGAELLAKKGDQTHAVTPTITFIPTIVYNDAFNAENQAGSLTDFYGTVCRILGDDACN